MAMMSLKRVVHLVNHHQHNNYNTNKNNNAEANHVDTGTKNSRTVPELSTWREKKVRTLNEEASYENPNELFETTECKAIKPWQLQSFPSCNSMHELDILQSVTQLKITGVGGSQARVYKYKDVATDTTIAFRNMKSGYDFKMKKMAEWRIDSLALERLTSSPNVMNIYGYCGAAGLYEFSEHPSLREQIRGVAREKGSNWPFEDSVDSTQLLRVAVDVTRGLADAHSFDGEYATLGHGDLAWDQYIYVDGRYKLIDFNGGFLLTWDPKQKKVCNNLKDRRGVYMWGSPEEFESGERTEKADVFALGNALFSLLTGYEIWDGDEDESGDVGTMLIQGKRSVVPKSILASEDPVIVAMLKAMNDCWEGDPDIRPSAKEVSEELAEVLAKIEIERNSTDGKRFVGQRW